MIRNPNFEGRNLILFFIIAFGWTWLFWLLPSFFSISYFSLPPLLVFFSILGTFGPTISAFITTFVSEKTDGVKKLLKKAIKVKFGLMWWMIIIFFYPAIFIIPYLVEVFLGIRSFVTPWVFFSWLPYGFSLSFFIGGGLTEEFGWRGYVLPRFQAKWNALISSLILGIIWACWHLPLVFLIPTANQYGINFAIYTLQVILFSITFTWVFNNSEGSVIGAVLLHALLNTFGWMSPFNFIIQIFVYGLILVAIDIFVIIYYGPKSFVRKDKVKEEEQLQA